ncbi:hypothetical protein DOY81_003967 [Sarcophaga bullata]|nr:hypothetical protein DOY81_003967 [Sarcophaga bullata]
MPTPAVITCQCSFNQSTRNLPQFSVASKGAKLNATKMFESRSSSRSNQPFNNWASFLLNGNSTAPIKNAQSNGRTNGPNIKHTATNAAIPAAIRKLYIAALKLSWFCERMRINLLRTLSNERSRLIESERFILMQYFFKINVYNEYNIEYFYVLA